MSDLKLFNIKDGVQELKGESVELEKSLQNLMEANLNTFLGINFLASEYSTGEIHGGRIDTVGIDENNCPVIIEYKRSMNQNVINQGLYYLDWLMDHKANFKLLVMEKLGPEIAGQIEWSSPRLLCIAGDFTKFDEHAVRQINRNIELIRYKKYEDELLLLELVNASTGTNTGTGRVDEKGYSSKSHKSVTDSLNQADENIKDLYENIKEFLLNLGDDVQEKTLRHYIAFKRFQNFACLLIHSKSILAYLKVDPGTVELEEGFTRDVTEIGHLGTGDLEVTLTSNEDFDRAKDLFVRSYEGS